MILTPIATLMLVLHLIAPGMSPAGDECHDSPVKPIVTEWTIVAAPGRIVIDARLEARDPAYPPSQFYYTFAENAAWTHVLFLRPVDESTPTDVIGGQSATVTDSTLHWEHPYPAGVYQMFAVIDGQFGGETQLCSGYFLTDTLVIPPDASDARRASLGAVKARWAR